MNRLTLATFFTTLLFSVSSCSSDECPSGTTDCDGTCVALSGDVDHCGACGNSCASDQACISGTCMDTGSTGCPVNLTDCSGTCVDTDADAANCGSCGNACTGGLVCSSGMCEVSCPSSQTDCSGACFDTQNAAQHCGDCGNACEAGLVCVTGDCEATCPTPQTLCGTACVTTDTDEAHCGGCGDACDPGELCVGGNCEISCGGGSVACNGVCTNTDTDRENCGGCDVRCAVDELCVAGDCALSCGVGQADCGGGTCTSTATDELNCGGCNVACGANELCSGGVCTLTCAGNVPDECSGACTNTLVDPTNCGACGVTCAVDEVCSLGSCAGQCAEGLAFCGGTCTSTLTDPNNCGGCGTLCAASVGSTSVCVSGTCGGVCDAGRADCNGDLQTSGGNGCETSLLNDATNCGACGFACTYPNAAATCSNAQCALGACANGFDDCDMDDSTGCESELAVDPLNCNTCGNACPVGNVCSSGLCVNGAETGEDCTGPLVLMAGTNTYAWAATTNDYVLALPSCQPTLYTIEGPDLVLRYTPTFTGFVDIAIAKPADNRFTMVISDAACGTPTELSCVSEYTATTMSSVVDVTANTDYFVYVVDTSSGNAVLPNPLDITVTETNCATQPAAQVTALDPAIGTVATELQPDLVVTFDQPVAEDVGIITITGNLGTNVSYDLSTNPAEVSFDATSTTMTIAGPAYGPGETVTVTWTGLVDGLCGASVPTPTPAWTFVGFTAPCAPGFNGMVGGTVTRVPSMLASFSEYFVSADNDPNGWVYAGGTGNLYRMSKDGVTVQDVEALAGLTSTELGYAMLVDGQNLYTVNESTTGTTGRVFRISSDGGATWLVEDAAGFSPAPADDFRAIDAYGGLVYLMTQEGSSTVPTEIWQFDPGSGTPAVATMIASISGYYNCGGLEVDMNYFYLACGSSEVILRVDRSTNTVEELTIAYDLSNVAGSLHGADTDADGLIDYLYAQSYYEEGYFVCGLGASNFSDVLFQFGTGASGNYGMGFDSVSNQLWMIDDGNRDFIRVD